MSFELRTLRAADDSAGRRRVVIDRITPRIEDGRFAVKRTPGEPLDVEADVFVDGHERIACLVTHRSRDGGAADELAMEHVGNDRWRATVTPEAPGHFCYGITAWIDRYGTFLDRLAAIVEAGQDATPELAGGAAMVEAAAARTKGDDARALAEYARALNGAGGIGTARAPELKRLMRAHDERLFATTAPELPLVVERTRARFSAWYELFPRSTSDTPGAHGTFADVARRLPLIADLGFDIVYLPPIHPIGTTARRGPNNTVSADPRDPGSPWAIGNADGGHDAIHPQLGSFDDFQQLVARATALDLELAMDLAFQCSPDHPYVRGHPEWFRRRPDGSIKHAENPPKKYLDIYPFDFETPHWRELWTELARVVRFWAAQGVRVFRVDNPHTKPFAFWEWLIAEVRRDSPDVIFLSEAFTRPKIMHRLAKLGFSQSYTYFTWKTTRAELTDYLEELTQSEVREFFRPNFWPNTPDILPEHLQSGGRPSFIARLVLAATLGASYGIYGPPYESCDGRAAATGAEGSEEYLDSEKYELRTWDWGAHAGLRDLIRRLNRIRRDHPALQFDHTLRFLATDNERLLAYAKRGPGDAPAVIAVVNLAPQERQAGAVELDLAALGFDPARPVELEDLLGSGTYAWRSGPNLVQLEPALPARILRARPGA